MGGGWGRAKNSLGRKYGTVSRRPVNKKAAMSFDHNRFISAPPSGLEPETL
jgi:hypothetical protein